MTYTQKRLRADLPALNAKLAAIGSDKHFEVEGRNGYTAVDLYNAVDGCLSTVATGTPRECATGCLEYIVAQIEVQS